MMFLGFYVNLSILLVSYNSRRYLADCLESIRQFAPPETEVIMADNASSDDSVDFVAREYPWVRIVRNNRNLGFSAANNLAGKQALGKFILLLNTDTVLVEPIGPAVDWLDGHPEYAVLTISMLSKERIPSACTGKFPSPLRLMLLRNMLMAPQQFGDKYAYEVDWVQGSFLLIRGEQWSALGGLDENYFMYVEDADLCKRVWDRGLKCAYLPQIRYIHFGGYSAARFSEQVRGLSIYVSHHMSGMRRLLSWGILCSGCLVRAIFFRTRVLLVGDEKTRTMSRASWLAFKGLLHMGMSV
jgi:GT2 family glycosyltransferase